MVYDKNYVTPIQPMNFRDGSNNFYIKRDDLLPFSFGGNKVRIAQQFFDDMEKEECDCIIAYGNSRSNLSRVIANMSRVKGIHCIVISPFDESGVRIETNNSKLVNLFESEIIPCKKENISTLIEAIINKCKSEGLKPYYIYGDKYGKGNESVGVQAYVDVFNEIRNYEKEQDIEFDYIFLASGTGTTQAGLICGSILNRVDKDIVGISIARNSQNGSKNIENNIIEYFKSIKTKNYNNHKICFVDKYVLDGYGSYNSELVKKIKEVLNTDGIPLDVTYTGKAFWGMTKFIEEKSITNKNILFIHTGGTPLFFDNLNIITEEGRW